MASKRSYEGDMWHQDDHVKVICAMKIKADVVKQH